jgi:crotonobetainyl-CoA:carnitine CoA-transferase CaiB-like acyl-CoA transferase
VLAALRQRERDGRGQLVDVAMLDVLVALIWDEPVDDYELRGLPDRVGNGDPRGAPIGTFQTADGWIALVVTSDAQFEQLCAMMDRRDLCQDIAGVGQRAHMRDQINAAVGAWTLGHPTDKLVEELTRIGVPCGPVNRAAGARENPQVAHRGMLVPLQHPDRAEPGPYLGPALPLKLSRAPVEFRPAEPLGQSTDAVLREVLGLGDDELRGLHARGVIQGCPE